MRDDGQINVRVPREMRERLVAICRVTGDRGLNNLCKRLLTEELERVHARLIEQVRDRAKEIVDDMVQQHGEEFPATVVITEYLNSRAYRELSGQQSIEVTTLAEHQALCRAVAGEIEERFEGRVKVVRQAIGRRYLRWIKSNNIPDSREARARFNHDDLA